jgi:effector-binding domain-containing protein
LTLPPGEWAVTVHTGRHSGIDRTYGALGGYVSERLLGIDGRVRENYLPDAPDGRQRTEICWPVFQTSTG